MRTFFIVLFFTVGVVAGSAAYGWYCTPDAKKTMSNSTDEIMSSMESHLKQRKADADKSDADRKLESINQEADAFLKSKN
jgi:hypothetical protein